jgi:hypothetical protein
MSSGSHGVATLGASRAVHRRGATCCWRSCSIAAIPLSRRVGAAPAAGVWLEVRCGDQPAQRIDSRRDAEIHLAGPLGDTTLHVEKGARGSPLRPAAINCAGAWAHRSARPIARLPAESILVASPGGDGYRRGEPLKANAEPARLRRRLPVVTDWVGDARLSTLRRSRHRLRARLALYAAAAALLFLVERAIPNPLPWVRWDWRTSSRWWCCSSTVRVRRSRCSACACC